VKYDFKNGLRFKAAARREEGRYLKYTAININKNQYKFNQLPHRSLTAQRTHVMENAVIAQPTALKPSLVKTTEFDLEKY